MEDLAANLDDGESWLPSDIFPTEDLNRSTAVGVTSIEDLNRHFNNLSFLHHHHHPLITHKPPISQVSHLFHSYNFYRSLALYACYAYNEW